MIVLNRGSGRRAGEPRRGNEVLLPPPLFTIPCPIPPSPSQELHALMGLTGWRDSDPTWSELWLDCRKSLRKSFTRPEFTRAPRCPMPEVDHQGFTIVPTDPPRPSSNLLIPTSCLGYLLIPPAVATHHVITSRQPRSLLKRDLIYHPVSDIGLRDVT